MPRRRWSIRRLIGTLVVAVLAGTAVVLETGKNRGCDMRSHVESDCVEEVG